MENERLMMAEEKQKNNGKGVTIEVDQEFIEVLNKLEDKIRKENSYGINKVGKRNLTKILARRIKELNLIK